MTALHKFIAGCPRDTSWAILAPSGVSSWTYALHKQNSCDTSRSVLMNLSLAETERHIRPSAQCRRRAADDALMMLPCAANFHRVVVRYKQSCPDTRKVYERCSQRFDSAIRVESRVLALFYQLAVLTISVNDSLIFAQHTLHGPGAVRSCSYQAS